MKHLLKLILGASLLISLAAAAQEPLPAATGTWNGFARHDITVDGQPVIVIAPAPPAAGRPWVWHGEFFGHKPVPDVALLGRGFHIVAMTIPDLFGSPKAIAHWNALHTHLTTRHGFAPKPALVGLSRGGLYCYNWAAQNPGKVACIYADAPVCDLKSWPLGKGQGSGNAAEVPKLLAAYGVKDEAALLQIALSPLDHLAPLAQARVSLLHVYGDADKGVPWEENTRLLAERYRALGGSIELIAKPGIGHIHGLEDSTPIIEFIARHGAGE